MVIKKEDIIQTEKEHFLDGEGTLDMFLKMDEHCKIMRLTLRPKSSIGYHVHTENYEILYIISGKGKVLEGDVTTPLKAGDISYCPKGFGHSLINDSDEPMEAFAVVPLH